MESNNFDFSAIVNIVRKNLLLFAVVGVIAVILSVVFSGPAFMEPRFKSVAVVYPYNINTYSDESETEQLLQLFEASSIRDTLIEKFDLWKRYGIEKGASKARFYLYQEYNERVVTSKTMYESVLLEVMDEDPNTAKLMADEILYQLNERIKRHRNTWGVGRAGSYKMQMEHQLALIDTLESRIAEISQENRVMDYEAQTRELVRAYVDELARSGNSNQSEEIENWLAELQQSGSLVQTLQMVNSYSAQQYGVLASKYLDWRAIGFEDINYLDVVVSPEVPDKKAWPVRWLVVMLSLVSALVLTLIVLAIGKFSK